MTNTTNNKTATSQAPFLESFFGFFLRWKGWRCHCVLGRAHRRGPTLIAACAGLVPATHPSLPDTPPLEASALHPSPPPLPPLHTYLRGTNRVSLLPPPRPPRLPCVGAGGGQGARWSGRRWWSLTLTACVGACMRWLQRAGRAAARGVGGEGGGGGGRSANWCGWTALSALAGHGAVFRFLCAKAGRLHCAAADSCAACSPP